MTQGQSSGRRAAHLASTQALAHLISCIEQSPSSCEDGNGDRATTVCSHVQWREK